MILEKKKDVRKTFISLVAVALFLALVLVLDQVINTPSGSSTGR